LCSGEDGEEIAGVGAGAGAGVGARVGVGVGVGAGGAGFPTPMTALVSFIPHPSINSLNSS